VTIDTSQNVTFVGSQTLSGGTANGVLYLNGSKAATSGSALVFDGTNLGVGVTPSAWENGRRALQISGSVVASLGFAGAISETLTNSYVNSGVFKYYGTGPAGNFSFNNQAVGGFSWGLAASGTAGNTATFAQAMTLDASGNLGIKSTSPSSFEFAPQLVVGNGSAANNGVTIYSSSSGAGRLHFADGTSGAEQYDGYIVYRHTTPTMEFGVGGTERARIDSSGRLMIGTTTAYDLLTVQGGIRGFSNGTLGGVVVADSGGTAQNFARMTSNGSDIAWGQNIVTYPGTWTKSVTGAVSGGWVIGADASCAYYTSAAGNASPLQNVRLFIDSTGKLFSLPTYNNTTGAAANMGVDSTAGVFYRSTSSLKYKRDVRDYDKGLETLMTLRSVYYKGTSERDGDTQYAGLIAEEVHDAGLPEFVQYAEDGTPDALAYGHMVSLLTKAIQEQQALIETLTQRITALEGR
jgi:hypothetical protein